MTHPPGRAEERRYVLDVLLGDRLGLDFHTVEAPGAGVTVTLEGDGEGRALELADGLFALPDAEWLTPGSVPRTPLATWRVPAGPERPPLPAAEVPVLFAGPGEPFAEDGGRVRVGVDLLGGAFFLLSRYEEAAAPAVGEHEWYPAAASLAARAGFLERPVVDEYAEVLWTLLSRLWPRLRRSERSARLVLSHDVDWPYSNAGRGARNLLRNVVGDVVVRRDVGLALRRVATYPRVAGGCPDQDVSNTFSWMMDRAERLGIRGAFFFIAGRTAGAIDGVYSLDEPWIRGLMRSIHERGHEIGLHTSYGTFLDADATRREFETLRRVCGELGIEQDEWGGRQHYLRWRCPVTWRNWDAAGLDYDSTVGFAEAFGFRTGTCRPHMAFDVEAGRRLRLVERPLVAMEVTGLDLLRLSPAETAERMLGLARTCARFGGDFTLLWHNSRLLSRAERAAYAGLLEDVVTVL